MVLRCLLACLFFLPTFLSANVDKTCIDNAVANIDLKSPEASNFLKIQGDLTLHRLAWAYLKAQKIDTTDKLESVEQTILALLDRKYSNTDADFIKAREQFEAQPLSRAALADLAPYLQDVLSHEFKEGSEAFVLNGSDLKLLLSLSKYEKIKSEQGLFDTRMLARKSPEGILNFAKLINSSYKISKNSTEDNLDIEMRLQGLEKTLGFMQKRLLDFVLDKNLISSCLQKAECDANQLSDDILKQNEEITNIFIESLTEKLTKSEAATDDLLLDNLTYGELWLKTGKAVADQEDEDKEDEIEETVPKIKMKNPAVVAVHKQSPAESENFDFITEHSQLPKLEVKGAPKQAKVEKKKETFTYSQDPFHLKNEKPWSFVNFKPQHTVSKIGQKTIISKTSPVKAFNGTKYGMVLDDPIDVIVRDKPGREAKNWKSFDKPFLNAMVDCIMNDDKVFIVDGKLYSRETGKNLTEDKVYQMMNLLSPGESKLLKSKIGQIKDKKIAVKMLAAFINKDKAFEHSGKMYTSLGVELEAPHILVAREMNKKTGKIVLPKRYAGFDKPYLLARATALMNNKPVYISGNVAYDTATGRNMSSPFRATSKTTTASIEKQRKVLYQNLSDKDIIINYTAQKTDKSGCQYYSIVDKKKAEITVYKLNGEKVFQREVLVGVKSSDVKTLWTEYNDLNHQGSYTTGAGAFQIGKPKEGKYYRDNYNDNILQVKGQEVFAIHQVPNNLKGRYRAFGTNDPLDRRVSQGCVNMKAEDIVELSKKYMKPGCNLYVLPEDPNNRFTIKDGRLEFLPVSRVSKPSNFNYTSNIATYKPIKFIFQNEDAGKGSSPRFVKALETEKSKLMSALNLNNDEYNELAAVAYGIMGNESEFGTHWKLWAKEILQPQVMAGKVAKDFVRRIGSEGLDWKPSKNAVSSSRGPTQIKYLPEGNWQKSYPEITKGNLMDPRNSAVATMAYLAGAMRDLRNISLKNKLDPKKVKISKESMSDYIGYLYQGNRRDLTSSTNPANPVINTYAQKLRKNMLQVDIVQEN